MSVSQGERRALQEALVETLGAQPADTMMDYLPPVGWADIVTKADLEHHAAVTKADLEATEHRVISQMRKEMQTQFYWLITIMIALLTLQGAVVTTIIKLT